VTVTAPPAARPSSPVSARIETGHPDVEIIDVTKVFGDVTAVDRMSLRIASGAFYSLLGPSGCGKTTTLRMIAGFEQPTAGEILLAGQPIAGVPPYRRNVNTVFQHYALFPHMDVAQNVGYGLRQKKVSRAEEQRRASEVLALVRLGGYEKRRTWELSGGQQQRVALARALVNRPTVLLLDEPLGALDKKLREHTQFEIMNIQEQTGITFVVVTHDQEEAMTLSTRIAVMDKGVIRQIGTPTDIYEFPRTRFVADFIGSINQCEGVVESSENGRALVSCPAWGGTIAVGHEGSLATGKTVAVAVRPEKIVIDRTPPATGLNAIRGKVHDLGYFGKDSLYRVKLEGGDLVRVNRVNDRRAGEVERVAVWEDDVWLSFDPAAAIVLER
jgi:putrescine transport system ATP-binding protein